MLLPILFLCLVIPPQGKAADSTAVAAVIDTYVQRTGFSGTILVAREGKPIYHRSYGLAYYATPDTIRNDYHYAIASITKLFTSIRVLQLVEDGKIDLEEPVVTYLPQLAALIPAAVTVHHLLLHISGLPAEQDRVYRHPLAPAALVEQTLRKNQPGEFGAFRYNNIDYMLLGLLIEELTGQSWEKAITASILEPLQLKHTGFLAYGNYPDNFAYSYSEKGKHLQQDPLFYIENFYAAGQLYSTTGDLLRLDQALYTDQLLNAASKQLLATSYPQYNYTGYGVWNYRYPFVDAQPTVMERRGGIMGANVVLVRLTDENYTVIILSNDDRFNPDSFGDEENLREMLIRSLY
jgi:CubicO group peptidase (beta-lactamase class C family)